MSLRGDATGAPHARWGDLGCIAVALFLGGWATGATGGDSGPYAPVNALAGVVAMGALWWRRQAPLAVAAVTFVAAGGPLAVGCRDGRGGTDEGGDGRRPPRRTPQEVRRRDTERVQHAGASATRAPPERPEAPART